MRLYPQRMGRPAQTIIATVLNMRAPGMPMMKMPIFVWTWFITAFLLIAVMPVLAGTVTMMLTKILVIALLFFVIYSLGSGLYYLLNDQGKSTRVVKALSWRIGISLVLFIFLMVGFYAGWMTPHVM